MNFTQFTRTQLEGVLKQSLNERKQYKDALLKYASKVKESHDCVLEVYNELMDVLGGPKQTSKPNIIKKLTVGDIECEYIDINKLTKIVIKLMTDHSGIMDTVKTFCDEDAGFIRKTKSLVGSYLY